MGTIGRIFEYGDIVRVTEGTLKGIIGCYDDDGQDGEMIVYVGPVGLSKYVTVFNDQARPATQLERKTYLRVCELVAADIEMQQKPERIEH